MAETKIQQYKIDAVAELKGRFEATKDFLFADYRGLSVEQITALRDKLRAAGAEFHVVKNAFAKIAFQQMDHEDVAPYLGWFRDEASGQLVTIGKAYSGLTDAELADMGRWFESHTISRHGRYRVVEPVVVVEVAFDVIMRSTRHRSGFALRFPRIARLRPDKSVDEIDTLATVATIHEGLQAGAEHLVTASARR